MAARCGQMLLSFVLVLVFVLMLVPVLVLVLVPCSFYFSSPSCSSCPPWSSFVVLVVSSQRCVRRGSRCPRCPPPAPRIFLLACLSSCWKSSAGRTPTRQRATFASKVMRSPARRAYLPQRSSQKIHHLAAQSSRAHRPDGANFAPSFFSPAAGRGRGQPAQTEPAAVRPPFFPGEGARANSWGQLPSITAEMRHRASSHCTR